MKIESTAFGTITIGGKTYNHDVAIRLSGEIVKRKKKLSKKYYGTSHVLSPIGVGHSSCVAIAAWPINVPSFTRTMDRRSVAPSPM
jgi:hypothetical protein